MQDKIPVGTTITTQPPTYVPLYVSLSVNVNPSYRNNTVKLNIIKAFLDDNQLFSFEQNTFARSIAFSKVISTAAGIEGVESVTVTKLNTDNGASAANISLSASQIPFLLPDNLIITTTGGLS
jgi:hypothetical protein